MWYYIGKASRYGAYSLVVKLSAVAGVTRVRFPLGSQMDIKNLAKILSEVSTKELGLLYYSPKEIEKNIQNARYVVFEENGKLAAFGTWSFRKDWAEIHGLYVAPEFRHRGYLTKVFAAIYEKLKNCGKTAVFFTQAPSVKHLAEKYGFESASHFDIPFGILLKIALHRLNPIRWRHYLKYWTSPFKLFKFQVFIRKKA